MLIAEDLAHLIAGSITRHLTSTTESYMFSRCHLAAVSYLTEMHTMRLEVMCLCGARTPFHSRPAEIELATSEGMIHH